MKSNLGRWLGARVLARNSEKKKYWEPDWRRWLNPDQSIIMADENATNLIKKKPLKYVHLTWDGM